MRRIATVGLLALMATVLTAVPAAACIGQIVISPATVAPGGEIRVRGFGFWADRRPVTLTWGNGLVIAVIEPDREGNFELTLRAPAAEGTFRIVATQGEFDPAPFYATLTVTASPARTTTPQLLTASGAAPSIPWVTLAIATGAALAVFGLRAGRGLQRTRHAG